MHFVEICIFLKADDLEIAMHTICSIPVSQECKQIMDFSHVLNTQIKVSHEISPIHIQVLLPR